MFLTIIVFSPNEAVLIDIYDFSQTQSIQLDKQLILAF